MDKPLNRRHILLILVPMLITIFACVGPATPTTPGIQTPTPTIDTAKVLTDSQIRRELPIVWMGPGNVSPLPRLRDSNWHDLAAGGKVTTDQDGEAWLDINDCLRIYLFQDSQLVKAACPKSSYSGGNVTCSLAGTGVYNNTCGSQVVLQTPSADVVLESTWVVLTYLPDEKLTVVVVAEGEADVWPVTEFDTRETTPRPITVHDQELLFTAPDDELMDISGLPPRVPLPLVDVYPLVEELGLGIWLDRTVSRADQDNVPFPQPDEIEREQAFVVRGAGGLLEDPQVAQAVAHAVDWDGILEEMFPDAAPFVTLQFREEDVTTDQLEFDPDFVSDLLEGAGIADGFDIAVLVDEKDGELFEVAKWISGSLADAGLQPEFEAVPLDSAPGLIEALQADGAPALWVGREFDGVDPVGAAPLPTHTPTPTPFCTVVSLRLNLRRGPGKVFAPPITTLRQETELIPLYRNPDASWIYVSVPDRNLRGWVSAGNRYVNCNRNIRQLPPTLEPPTPTPTRTPTATHTPTPTPTRFVTPTPENIISLPGIHPSGLALDPERGRLFVAGRDSNAVHVIDEKTLRVIAEIPVGQQPFNLHYDGRFVYVANFGSDSVSVIDPNLLEEVAEVRLASVGGEPTFMSSKDGLVYVVLHKMTEGSGLVTLHCGSSYSTSPANVRCNLGELVVTGYGAYGLAVAQNVGAAYVSNRDSFEVTSLSIRPELRTLPKYSARDLAGSPYVLAFNSFFEGSAEYFYLYLTHSAPGGSVNQPNLLTVYTPMPELFELRTVDIGDAGRNGGYISVFPKVGSRWDHTVWVSADRQVSVFEPDLGRKITAFGSRAGIGSNPFAIVFSPTYRKVYVSDGAGDFITALEIP
ncbi:MAG: hypothetical protein U9R25_12685 [Chloroflexota bacterium]|nr:hypothetical protein [Chloroflexota bacterium]